MAAWAGGARRCCAAAHATIHHGYTLLTKACAILTKAILTKAILTKAILTKAYYTLLTKACAPLLRLLGALASPMASLGVPHVDACGESDGGGPRGDACAELAAELAGLGARLLGLLEEQVA